jgi:signal-transduction protein with cAMP-binding, CBS, and nucleotidyltransferase domain
MNDAAFLARVSLFSLMTKSELERIAKLAGRHMFHAGDIIIREGDPDKRLFTSFFRD